MKTRALAAEILQAVFDGRSLTQSLNEISQKPPNFNLVQETCYGVMRWHYRLAFFAGQLTKKPLKEKDNDIFALLLLGIYQIEFLNIPEYAIVQETVNACQVLKKPWAKKFVNAILRQYLRQRESLQAALPNHFTAYYSHPQWLIDTIKKAHPVDWKAILDANNQRAPLTLRINATKTSREAYLKTLSLHNINAIPSNDNQHGVTLTTPQAVETLPGFSDGLFAVQDNAAQLAAELLGCQAGERILDACAAPGGKTCHILENADSLQKLIAIDKDAARLKRIEENLKRLDLHATLKCADAEEPEAWWDKKPFDRILLDTPCSATGVIRRHPDIKYCRKQSDINQLHTQQSTLLNALWPLLKVGGTLLYATCSILPDENEHVIARFLEQTPDAKESIITTSWGMARTHGRQLLPGKNDMDGFYYALLEKQ